MNHPGCPRITRLLRAELIGIYMRFRYTVIEDGSGQEKYLEVGKRTSEDIDSFLQEGVSKLKGEAGEGLEK